ncbi:MAG: tRNA (guanosine(37)-N1)-methyltransferase TrmD [Fimbriimonadaceae bacterium]
MKFIILTLFPEVVCEFLQHGVIGKALATGAVELQAVHPRDFAKDAHRSVDDSPCGGGAGMVLRYDVMFEAFRSIELQPNHQVALMDPRGEPFSQPIAKELARADQLILICGHYGGVDERIRTELCHRTISLGDFVLTGGEIPALAIVDAVTRLQGGVLGNEESLVGETFEGDLLGYPQFTRPVGVEGALVPDVLLSGDHQAIRQWRRQQALMETARVRPDLLAKARLEKGDADLLK